MREVGRGEVGGGKVEGGDGGAGVLVPAGSIVLRPAVGLVLSGGGVR